MQIPGTVSSMSSLLAQLSTHPPFPSTSTIFSAHPKCRELCNDVHTNWRQWAEYIEPGRQHTV